ncbi:MAG TPA: ATP-binding protein [Candidatus Saccharimonadia bacterium]|nr:ATP-binding protein [Candidatus Saccharimonadia bacterium]
MTTIRPKTWLKQPVTRLLLAWFGLMAVVGGIGQAAVPSALAGGSYTPLDVLGHSSGSGPDYTNSDPNGAPIGPNATGYIGVNGSAVDSSHHRLFVVDTSNNRVLVYALSITDDPTARTPVFVLGQTDVTSAAVPSPPTASSLSGPTGLAYDSTNNRLFVADTGNNRILMYDLTSGISDGMAAAHVLGQSDFTSNSPSTFGSPTATDVFQPTSLAYDATGQRLFVGDQINNRVLEYDLSGGMSDGMAAAHVLGQPNFTTTAGGTGPMDTLAAPLPGLAYDGVHQRLFVATNDYRVLVFDLSGGVSDGMAATNRLGQAIAGGTISQNNLHNVGGLAYDGIGDRLFVADRSANRVLVYSLSGGLSDGMNAANVLGQANFTASDSHLNQTGFWSPTTVSYDEAQQRLWVSDGTNARLMEFNLNAGLSNNMSAGTELGQTTPGGTATYATNNRANNQPLASSLNSPDDVELDATRHRLFVLDYANARILVYNLGSQNQRLSDNADLVLGQSSLTAGAGLIQTADNVGNAASVATASNVTYGAGLAYDAAHQWLFVTETSPLQRVMVFDFSGSLSNGMPATHVLGRPNLTDNSFMSSSGPATANAIANPAGLTYNPTTQELFVADAGNNRVMVYDLSSGLTDNMNASHVLGQPDLGANTSNTGATGLNAPQGVYYDAAATSLAVADSGNNRVLLYDISGGVNDGMAATAVLGQIDFNGTGSATTATTLNDPTAIAYDPDRNYLLVSDSGNSRVLAYDASGGVSTGQAAALALGQPDLVSSNFAGGQDGLNFPLGIRYDPVSSRLLVADSGNSRVMVYGAVAAPSPTPSPSISPSPSVNPSATPVPTTAPSPLPTKPTGSPSLSPSPTITPSPAPSPSPSPGPVVDLTTIPTFVDGSGYSAPVKAGDRFSFTPTAGDRETYLINVLSATTTAVSLSINPARDTTAATTYHLAPNKPITPDVNADHQADVRLTQRVDRQGVVRLVFASYRSLINPAPVRPLWQRLIRQVPVPVWLGFPYLLFVLLGLAMAWLVVALRREVASTTRQRQFYELQARVAQQKDVFRQLASHYLRTPLTLVRASVDAAQLPADAHSAPASQAAFGQTVGDLARRVEEVLGNIQANTNAASALPPAPTVVSGLGRRPSFWLPIGILGLLVVVCNLLASLAGAQLLGWWLNLAIQGALLIAMATGLYALLRSRRLKHQEQAILDRALADQAQFDAQRNRFMSQAVAALQSDVTALQAQANQLANAAAQQAATEGLNRFAQLLARFALVTRLTAANQPPQPQPVKLAAFWQTPAVAAAKHITLHTPPDQAAGLRDPQLFGQVMSSLLDNAAAYSNEGGQVDITTSRTPGQLTLAITDHGQGMPPDFANQLFKPFAKAEGALTFQHEGAGLSLYLDQLIMTYLGGTIQVQSALGRGTTVTLTLPQPT